MKQYHDKSLLIDFGATHVKWAVYDFSKDKFVQVNKIKCAQKTADEYTDLFKNICNSCKDYKSIFISSQMHGFFVLDENNKPLTDYISWQEHHGEIFEIENFKKITGMEPRPGLPIFNLRYISANNDVEDKIKICSIPDLLSNVDDNSTQKSHISMSAAMGFFDVKNRQLSTNLLNLFDKKISFNDVVDEIVISGYYKSIPIYTGIGDLQCALLGAIENMEDSCVIVNIGTGSQVCVISKSLQPPEKAEYRPFFDNFHLHAITHLPAGRALNSYLQIFDQADIWKEIKRLTFEDIINSTLNIDLAIFASAVNYKSGGAISNIQEGKFSKKNFLASLVNCLAKQYTKYIKDVCECDINYIILSGGFPRNVPIFTKLMKYYTGRPARTLESFVDETLVGLKKIARMYE